MHFFMRESNWVTATLNIKIRLWLQQTGGGLWPSPILNKKREGLPPKQMKTSKLSFSPTEVNIFSNYRDEANI